MQLQGGGGRRRGGGPPARARPSVGESTTDDNAADARAGPRDAGMIQTTGPGRAAGTCDIPGSFSFCRGCRTCCRR
ncbi:hypothetical protein E4U92_15190 [Streptomyces galbus]|uniref:Uncharacterized protein n=1 Tax=Streptomyces galbus TaxID=33898 RepID=A0A4U5X1S0_STRGB|nr:hypothetical protein E4U92_15190 [Streptomyces galbus]